MKRFVNLLVTGLFFYRKGLFETADEIDWILASSDWLKLGTFYNGRGETSSRGTEGARITPFVFGREARCQVDIYPVSHLAGFDTRSF